MAGVQPWKPADATIEIRRLASTEIRITYTEHSRDRMTERDLLVSDVLHVLKHGVVYGDAEPSTKAGYYKYRIEARTPNSGNREVGVVVIPDPVGSHIKIVTVMWIDGT
jgi:hypothetical protein